MGQFMGTDVQLLEPPPDASALPSISELWEKLRRGTLRVTEVHFPPICWDRRTLESKIKLNSRN